MIVKVQVPLATTLPGPQCLVYNQDKSIEFMWEIDPALKLIMGGYPKKYFEARILNGTLELMSEVEDPKTW